MADLTVSGQGHRVVALPLLSARATNGLVVAVALAETAGLLASGSEAAHLAVLVHRLGDPVDARVAADGLVLRVHADDLKVLVGGVLQREYQQPQKDNKFQRLETYLVDPVRVQDTQVAAAATDTLLGHGAQSALGLEGGDTLALGLSVHLTLGLRALAATTAHADAVDDKALLGLVAETASLVGARRTRRTVQHRQLAVLPAAQAHQETQHVGLLLLVQLLDELVGTHLERRFSKVIR